MKITLEKTEIQTLLAKALNVPANKLTIDVKSIVVNIDQGVDSLSFGGTSVPTATQGTQESPKEVEATDSKPAPEKQPAGKAGKKKETVKEEELEQPLDDSDDIDFL
jgi:hypothetical protein